MICLDDNLVVSWIPRNECYCHVDKDLSEWLSPVRGPSVISLTCWNPRCQVIGAT